MSRRYVFPLAVLLLFAMLAVPHSTARAFARSDEAALSCDGFSSSGPANAPFVFLAVSINYSGEWDYYTVVPVVDGRYTGHLSFPKQPEGTPIHYALWGALANVGINDPGAYDGDEWASTGGDNPDAIPCAAIPFAGPGLPSGFVLKTITCDVAVFDSPGGKPVGSNQVKAGQTWYVSPAAQTDGAGEDWIEIFVSGFTNGYVPSRCVN